VFRRRQRDHEGRPAIPGRAPAGHRPGGVSGPWDLADEFPAMERVDLGSLQVPAVRGLEILVGMTGEQPASVTVLHGESGLELQAFAAPKSSGLWDEARAEIAAEVTRSGGRCEEAGGLFGKELHAWIPAASGPGGGRLEPVRFLGVDGPRWFLRGAITGPAARDPVLARPLERVFADVVVVRGDHPVPPRDLLEIQLPGQAAQALAGQLADGPGEHWPLNPFQRGPEITQTR
jgi:hypothetical protein